MSHTDPRSAFPAFYTNPTIKAIGDVPRWTVSDSDKMPVNMRELMTSGRLWGAHEISDQCLVTLDELANFLPNAANNAYYVRAQVDGFVVLDIEKTCPPERAAELLQIPSRYSEYSMSGKGYHLVLPLPSNFWDFPIATGKRVLKDEHGYFEILLDHWVTFTRQPVAHAPVSTSGASALWDELYASLAKDAVEVVTSEFEITVDRPDVPRIDQILGLMTRRGLDKGLDDFGGDASRFEFSSMGTLYNRLSPILVAIRDAEPDAVYDEPVMAWLVYEAARQLLPHREKHDQVRSGIPLLLNAATSLVAQRAGAQTASSKPPRKRR